jgi:hypothetical protein
MGANANWRGPVRGLVRLRFGLFNLFTSAFSDPQGERTALMMTALTGNSDIASILLEYGADMTICDEVVKYYSTKRFSAANNFSLLYIGRADCA